MAELQWIIEVRCTNALLAQMKVGEKGEHIIVNVPDMNFDPSEFDKLIEGVEVSSKIAMENMRESRNAEPEGTPGPIQAKPSEAVGIVEQRDLYQIKILKTGEIVSVNVQDRLFAPSELERFLAELKAVKAKMMELRKRPHRAR